MLKEKLKEYIQAGQVSEDSFDAHVEVFEQMRGVIRESNIFADPGVASAKATEEENRPMSDAELRAEVALREKLMQRMHEQDGAWTDQWRVYSEIVEALTANAAPLRLFLQASAGTGKSFLLETLYLWCFVNGFNAEACAPTGIAAARIRVLRTPVHAFTLHHFLPSAWSWRAKSIPASPKMRRRRGSAR